MKRRVLAVLVFFAVLTVLVPLRAGQRGGDDEPRLRVRIAVSNADVMKASLETSGYDVLETRSADSTLELVVSAAQLRALEKSGFSVVVIEESRPLQQALASKALEPKALAGPSSAAVAAGAAAAAAVPASYRNLAAVITRMQEIAAAYPQIATFVDLTNTYNTPPTSEGRHMFALKISDHVTQDEDEPAMLIVGTHHAREINVPVIGLDAAERLTSRYNGGGSGDAEITAAVNGNEIWIAPIWNPDGYNYVFTSNNMWRKNRRVLSGGVGVDQNRNYPQAWSTSCAGSTSPSSDTYKGPSPGSEPETQTLMTWSRTERFAKVIDYHSSGREVLFAYRCLGHPFTTWFQQEAAALSLASGYGRATRVPSAEGEHPEWQFAQMGAYAFLIETGLEFQPSYQSALQEAALVWPGILKVLARPISVSGHVTDRTTGEPLSAKIDLLNVPFTQGETNASGGPYGEYHMFLPPGTYDVRFSLAGYAPVTSHVVVTATSAAVNEIEMSPAAADPVLFCDDFETNKGWTRNPNGTDTATTGLWERGNPESTTSSGTKQLGTTVSGVNDLVTGRLAGTSSGTNDLDNGSSSIQSPAIVLPSSGNVTLTFSYYLAHGNNSSTADYLRVSIVGTTTAVVLQELGAADNDDAAWTAASVSLNAFAGQTIRIRVEAADASGASLVEAAIDDMTVTNANHSPVAVDDSATTPEDAPATIAVLANDSDPDGDSLSVTAVGTPLHGSAAINPNWTIAYTPAANYKGADSFTYTIGDGHAGTDTAAVNVTISPVNDRPVAANDTATTAEDTAVTIAVLANDTDRDGDGLSLTSVSVPAHGAAAINADGTIAYTPAANYNGADSFTYTMDDGHTSTATATVSVIVTAVNDAPVAGNNTVTTAEDTALTIGAAVNNSDVDGDTLVVSAVTVPAHGTAVVNADGSATYAPAANYNGGDSFSYTVSDGHGGSATGNVSVVVTPVNDTPVAANDTAVTDEDTAVTIAVGANDSDVDGDALVVSAVTAPAHGTAVVNADGSATYAPAANYNGGDSFSYTVSDGHGGGATGNVSVTVNPVNDAPSAANDLLVIAEDTAAMVAVLSNDGDADGDSVSVTEVGAPEHGSAAVDSDGMITYTPAANYNGPDSFLYTITDGHGASATATVSVTVTEVNDGPQAADDRLEIAADTVATIDVLANDTAADGGGLVVTAVSAPEFGSVEINPDSTVTYTPDAGFSGPDAFTYTISDEQGNTATATVRIKVIFTGGL